MGVSTGQDIGAGRSRPALALVLVGGACSDDGDGSTAGDGDVADEQESATITVPGDHETIQARRRRRRSRATWCSSSPGIYDEAVDVTTDDLTIRGLDRDGVVLDGDFELANGIRVLGADGVAVENLTVQNYTANGVFWTGVDGSAARTSRRSATRVRHLRVRLPQRADRALLRRRERRRRLLRRPVLPVRHARRRRAVGAQRHRVLRRQRRRQPARRSPSTFRSNRIGIVAR